MTIPCIIILSVAFIGLWAITKSPWTAAGCVLAIVAFHGLWWATAWLIWAAHQ